MKNDELRTVLATQYTFLSSIAPTPEALRLKSKEYKEQSERLSMAKAERILPAGNVPRGQSPMELLAPRELSQTMEVRVPTGSGKVTIPDSSEILGDPNVEKTIAGGGIRWSTRGQQDCTSFRGDCTLENN